MKASLKIANSVEASKVPPDRSAENSKRIKPHVASHLHNGSKLARIKESWRRHFAELEDTFKSNLLLLNPHSSPKLFDLDEDIAVLRKHIKAQSDALEEHWQDRKEQQREIASLKTSLARLQQKQALAYLLNSVSDQAHDTLFADEAFRSQFLAGSQVDAFVVCVDVRRSTELMLRAQSPSVFTQFMKRLCGELTDVFKSNYGVVDRFTGDGIIAFFPGFYSGPDAGYYAVSASCRAQVAFEACYKDHRRFFSSMLKDVGLGIGIGFGAVHLLNMGGPLTVVGKAVVHACRLAAAPAGTIYLNQPAFEKVAHKLRHVLFLSEEEVLMKHEKASVCYRASLTRHDYQPERPLWTKDENGEAR